LDRAGISLNFCDIKGTLMPSLNAAGFEELISGQIFFSADRAMKHFADELLTEQSTDQSTFNF
jgi:hypothetical protein